MPRNLFVFFFPLFSVFCDSFGLTLTEHFQQCSVSDNKCLNHAIEEALHYLCQHGLPELDIPKMDPIKISEIKIGTKGKAVQVLQKYTDVKTIGFANATISKAHLDADKKILTFTTTAPKFDQIAHYDIKGRLLIFPIFGSGKSVLTQSKVAVIHTIKFKEEILDGETYWKILSYDVNMTPERISFKFDNLFNGNRILSDRVHEVVNENWEALWTESKRDFEDVYAKLYKKFAEKLFNFVPINTIFKF